jgi:hypothetical protein
MSKLISPNELHDGAKLHMLEGKNPITENDWMLCVNFWAANIGQGFEDITCSLMAKIYACPLNEGIIRNIALFQMKKKIPNN